MAEPSLLTTSSASAVSSGSGRKVRLAYFVSHPIQYQAPLLRRIAQEPDIDLTAFFSSDLSVREQGFRDEGFGVKLRWDVPLLEGYNSEFLPRIGDGDTLGIFKPLNWGILKRLRKGRFDAVWVLGYHRLVYLQAMVAARFLRLPVLIETDSNLYRVRTKRTRIAKSIFAKMLKPLVTGVLAVGDANAAYWRDFFGADMPLFDFPYAVDNEFFRERVLQAAAMREELRRELNLEPGRSVILYAAKLLDWKRPIDLIEAYIRLCPGPGIDPAAYLLIVGDGEERSRLEARVRESGLTSIRFLGFKNQTEIPRFFELCDVFVLPSDGEPWGLVVNEVMNAGRAVILSDRVGCGIDLVRHGYNGLIYPCGDTQALSESLRHLLEDPALCAAMGENSLRMIQQHSFEQDVAGLREALAHLVPGFRA